MHLSVESSLSPSEILDKALAFFGKGGIGMAIVRKGSESVSFEGGGGFVMVSVVSGDTTTVELETREWENQVREFARGLKA